MRAEGSCLFLPCYHTEWFVGAALTQVSLFVQVCLGIASQSQVLVTFVKMRLVPSRLLQRLETVIAERSQGRQALTSWVLLVKNVPHQAREKKHQE